MKIIINESQVKKMINKLKWEEVSGKLIRTYYFKDYKEVMPFVDSVMKKYKSLKSTTEEETEKLEKELKQRFAHVAKDLDKTKKKVTKKVDTARTNIAKKIAPKK